jgi:UDP-glucose 4-epimerase
VVGALIKLSKEPKALGEVFNVGSQEEISIEQLAKKIIKLTKSRSKIVYVPYETAYEEGFEDMQRRIPDITKIGKYIGFKPTLSLAEIIKDIVGYLKSKS